MFAPSIIRRLLCSSAVLSLVCLVDPALADSTRSGSGGALGQTTRAVDRATGGSSSTSGGSSSSSSSSDDSSSPDYDDDYDYSQPYCATCTYAAPGPPPAYAHGPRGFSHTRLALELGLQSVHDSDGAGMIDARVMRHNLGFGFAGTRYFESGRAMDGSDTIYMNVWALTVALRGFDNGRTQVWLNGGMAGSGSNNFESLTGGTVGVELLHAVGSAIKLRGTARYFVLEQSMRASEVRAAISASYFSLGYRVFRFNVGVPLYGPEFGLSLGF
jgi:hypothetical protein